MQLIESETRNPGLLYGGLTVSDIREKMVSLRRNELLAELFQRSHLIEKWGRGIKLILAKEPATEFEEVGSMLFVARFWRKGLQKGVTGKTDMTSQESSGKTENQVLSLLSERPEMTIPELAETLKITTRGIEKQIAKLQDAFAVSVRPKADTGKLAGIDDDLVLSFPRFPGGNPVFNDRRTSGGRKTKTRTELDWEG